jgi:rhodanese-related sulfurtransferase
VSSQVNNNTISSDLPEISREELRRRLHDPALTIVDVLPPASYAAEHISGALSIPLEQLVSRAAELLPNRDAEIVVYCGKLSCERSPEALRHLQELGYSNVRDYPGGLADWIESGGPTENVAEKAAEAPSVPEPAPSLSSGPPLTVPPGGIVGRGPARVPTGQWDKQVLRLVERTSTLQLFLIWTVMIMLSGVVYWLGALLGEHGLLEEGAPVGVGLKGLTSALYFSFVTAISLGYGDIVPIGFVRVLAIAEGVAGLLVFGAVIAKFVSHKQDELVSEIHRVTFDDRLDRLQTNLHLVISEMLSVTAMFEAPHANLQRVSTRLDSAALIFLSEMRAIHDLLYQPRLAVEEGVLASILATLASALSVFSELLQGLPAEFGRSQPLAIAIENLTRMADEICGTCMTHDYTPRLVYWMDRIQATARTIK